MSDTTAADALYWELDKDAFGRIVLHHYIYKPLTVIEQVFGPDSLAAKIWLEFSLGKEDESTGARCYYRLLRREDGWVNKALKKSTGLDRLDEWEPCVDWLAGLLALNWRYMDWLIRPLALDLPDAGRVELAVDEWMGLRNTCRDGDGNLLVRLVPLKRAANRAQAPFAKCLTSADREAMFEGLDHDDPRTLKVADAYYQWHQRKEFYRKVAETWHAIKGWWPDDLPGYYPLHRDIPREAPSPIRPPGKEYAISDHMDHAIRELDFMQERTSGAISPLLIKGAELEYLTHSRIGAALVAYGVPAKNIEKMLNAGEPSLLRRMEATVGRTVARSVWVDSVRHILDAAGLSPATGLRGNQRLD